MNRDRQLNGLLPLVEDPLLSQSSQQHSQDMMSRNYYAHVTPEGRTPTESLHPSRRTRWGGRKHHAADSGTGISLSYGLIEAFQKSWMYSTGHRQNLLKPDYKRFWLWDCG
ncbi:hypothetical protein JOY44_24530 (plasmid) [Phormidium sp. CLA17]|nr:hypothetical protein [Leptolyngbya sp. Cla-17]